jgi:Cu(I)/Ag(I) efflux system membrane fusion protein
MRILQALVLAAIVAASIGCSNAPEPKAAKTPRGPISCKLDSAGTKSLTQVISDYYSLKNALVATNAADAENASKKLMESTGLLAQGLQKDSVNYPLLKPYLDTIVAQSFVISGEKGAKCERQRLAFSPLSNNMFALLKAVDIKNAGMYKQFCPMAFNDKGAFWLSDESEIKNPYFGKKMLECGEVQDSL